LSVEFLALQLVPAQLLLPHAPRLLLPLSFLFLPPKLFLKQLAFRLQTRALLGVNSLLDHSLQRFIL
jgi:hypothetical protein